MAVYIIVSILVVIIGGVIAFLLLKGTVRTLSSDIMRNNNENFLMLAKKQFETEQQKAKGELDLKREQISKVVSDLERKLSEYEDLVRAFEKERDTKYGSIEQQIKSSVDTTTKLQDTTDRLTSILGNVKLRGQWGERMAEDILNYAGLVENVHFVKNKSQDTVATRPDYTFLLPEGHKVNMDVKFPLDKYLKLQNTKDETERKKITQEFIRDVKGRIKEVQNRDYINIAERTLGYVILFIPNEQVYGFIHDAEPQLIDDSIKQKVILCSPFTLYAVLSVIRQAYDNFYFTQRTQDIIKIISEFTKTYETFRNRFEELGQQLAKTQAVYEKISTTSYKMMDSKIRKIEQYRKGNTEEELAEEILKGSE